MPATERVPVTACEVGRDYLVGDPPERLEYVGASLGFYFFGDAAAVLHGVSPREGGRVRLSADAYVFEAPWVPRIDAVNPPDAPRRDPVERATPLPPEVIATISDLEVRARAEQHAASHAAMDAAARAAAGPGEPKTAGRCPGGGKERRVQLDADALATRKWKCPVPGCGRVFGIKPAKEGDAWVATIPGHNFPKPEEGAGAAAVPAIPSIPSATAVPAIPTIPSFLLSGSAPAIPPIPSATAAPIPSATAVPSIPPIPSATTIPSIPTVAIPSIPVIPIPAIPAIPPIPRADSQFMPPLASGAPAIPAIDVVFRQHVLACPACQVGLCDAGRKLAS